MITYHKYNNGYNDPAYNTHTEMQVLIVHRSTLYMANAVISTKGYV